MIDAPRYAIYFVPAADSELYWFGAHLLGYDSYHGVECAFPTELTGSFSDWRAITNSPRRYGFHATLKAPFQLREGRCESELREACRVFARVKRPVPSIAPAVTTIGDFIAVTPSDANSALCELANECVRRFEDFRAPMTPEERARRHPERLTKRQAEHLDRWGYPHVFEDFRFYMSLTGRLADERRAPILQELQDHFAALEAFSVTVDRLALCRQATRHARFTIVETFSL